MFQNCLKFLFNSLISTDTYLLCGRLLCGRFIVCGTYRLPQSRFILSGTYRKVGSYLEVPTFLVFIFVIELVFLFL